MNVIAQEVLVLGLKYHELALTRSPLSLDESLLVLSVGL